MKRAWSILLGEPVDARDVGHGDAADFQIVCEVCREPVFKTERRDTHFLSHYPAAARWAAECELRVETSMREDARRGTPSIDRGQSLSHYLSIFETMVSSLFGPMMREPLVRRGIRSDAWTPLRLDTMRTFRDAVAKGEFESLIILSLEHRGRAGSPMRTFVENFERRFPSVLQRRMQKDTAVDMARALCTPAAARSLSFLVGVAFFASGPDLRRSGALGTRTYRMFSADRRTVRDTMMEIEALESTDALVRTILLHALEVVTLVDYVGFLPSPGGETPKATSIGFGWEWDEERIGEASGPDARPRGHAVLSDRGPGR